MGVYIAHLIITVYTVYTVNTVNHSKTFQYRKLPLQERILNGRLSKFEGETIILSMDGTLSE